MSSLLTLDGYQNLASKTAIYPGKGTSIGLTYIALKLNGEAGEVAENVGKAVRDDGLLSQQYEYHNGVPAASSVSLTPERKAKLLAEAGDVLWYLSQLATELGTTLGEIAEANILKLSSRAERGVLRGSGDDR